MDNNESGCGTIVFVIFVILCFNSAFQQILSGIFLLSIVFCFIGFIVFSIICIVVWITSVITNRTQRVTRTTEATTTLETNRTPTNITEHYKFKDLPDDIDNILRDISFGEIKDPVTQETFQPGDTVYLCHRHRLAYHEDSWNDRGRQCIDCKSNAHTKKHVLPLISKINPLEDILWKDLTLELPIKIPSQQLEPIEVVDDYGSTLRDGGGREAATDSYVEHEDTYSSFYRLIDRLTQLPSLEVSAVQNVLEIIFNQEDTYSSFIKYEANNLRNSLFSRIWLVKSRSNEVNNFLHLEIVAGLIPFSDIIIHYDLTFSTRLNCLFNGQNLLIPINEKEIGNYQVRFYVEPNGERSLIKVLLYPILK